jgi:hypothetical protein
MLAKTMIALGFIGTMAAAATPSVAQGVYFEGPGFEVGVGRPAYRERYYRGRGRGSAGAAGPSPSSEMMGVFADQTLRLTTLLTRSYKIELDRPLGQVRPTLGDAGG